MTLSRRLRLVLLASPFWGGFPKLPGSVAATAIFREEASEVFFLALWLSFWTCPLYLRPFTSRRLFLERPSIALQAWKSVEVFFQEVHVSIRLRFGDPPCAG